VTLGVPGTSLSVSPFELHAEAPPTARAVCEHAEVRLGAVPQWPRTRVGPASWWWR
jgi:hypothetical protein